MTRARGWCEKHYRRWLRYGDPNILHRNTNPPKYCTVNKCDRVHYAKNLCKKHYHLVRMYNVSKDWMASMSTSCEVCEITETESHRPLMVDHDHKTGDIRGVLCVDCNLALGYIKDSPHTAISLANYLQG